MYPQIIPWLVSGVALGLSVLGWGQDLGWQLTGISAYEWFPLFGLIAFSLMWAHYATDFLGKFFGFQIEEGPYLQTTRYIVLFAILIHPGLLAWLRWSGGFGWPPFSWLNFVGPEAQLGIILGIVAWLAFVGFELHYWYRNKPWFKWIILANAAAMLMIVVHVIYVAEPTGWFLYLWYFFGASLVVFFLKEHYDNYSKAQNLKD